MDTITIADGRAVVRQLLCRLFLLLLLCQMVAECTSAHTVYMIRHAEKPSDSSISTLSAAGTWRASCVAPFFSNSPFALTKLFAQRPKFTTTSNGERILGAMQRPYTTITPLSQRLSLPIDMSCERDDTACITTAIRAAVPQGNVLVCWEHSQLAVIATALGVTPPPSYPGSHFDLVWAWRPDAPAQMDTTYQPTDCGTYPPPGNESAWPATGDVPMPGTYSSTNGHNGASKGAIIGGVVGGILGCCLAAAGVVYGMGRWRSSRHRGGGKQLDGGACTQSDEDAQTIRMFVNPSQSNQSIDSER